MGNLERNGYNGIKKLFYNRLHYVRHKILYDIVEPRTGKNDDPRDSGSTRLRFCSEGTHSLEHLSRGP